MCGIAGAFGTVPPDAVRNMLGSIVHRGPDDGHDVRGDGFALGARRLSIIDVEGGRQPLCNETGDVWVAQNGEIYNFPILRDQLLARGHQFRTRCDTEAIVHLYEEKELDLPRHLDGMFAIAVYDTRCQRGLLLRDRCGKKPLYYAEHDGALYFASEIKALRRTPGIGRDINWEAIHHFLSYKHVPCPLTAYTGISMLPPASMLVWEKGRITRVERYWSPSFAARSDATDETELVEGLLERLKNGVKRRLISDVPIGFFLSGGVDSSLSTCIAAELSDTPIKTFTLSYSESSATPGKNEDVACARRIAKQYGTEHHEEVIDFASFTEDFPRILSHFDEPFSGVISTWFLARLISRHVKVTLSGDGADELFGSYLSHRLAQPMAECGCLLAAGQPVPPFEGKAGYLEQLYGPHDWAWRYRLLTFSDADKHALYSPALQEASRGFSTERHMERYFSGLTATDPLNRVLEAEFHSFFPDQVMAFVDRLSMAHSLEVRTAFLDTEFVEYCAGLPAHFKIRGNQTKVLLKKAALKYLPEDIVYRPKEGFVMPINGWLMQHLEGYVREFLSPARLQARGFFNPQAVQSLVSAFYAGNAGLANKVFSLLAFEVWYDTCLQAPACMS